MIASLQEVPVSNVLIEKKIKTIAVIGLGYVGLPLAVAFSSHFDTIGFDINQSRVDSLNKGTDSTKEISRKELKQALIRKSGVEKKGLIISTSENNLAPYNTYIITVPTPVDKNKRPLLGPLISASRLIGMHLKKGDIVIYESTVYPGATEEICAPILEEVSGLKFNLDFFCGYSPERINPGDKKHTLHNIKKLTSGSTPKIAQEVDEIYKTIITAGTHCTSSIRVAEAAKVIENAQRDINIAFVNELAKIFNLIGIDTQEVLHAASTKWNFLNFKPGLVGGHCIGVDPYYLADKAQAVGYHPEIILSGRRLNDSMGTYISLELIKLLVTNHIPIVNAKVLVLGITFKENCPDIRNSKVMEVYEHLSTFQLDIDVFDPWADEDEVAKAHDIELIPDLKGRRYNAILHAVAHEQFQELDIPKLKHHHAVVYDVKGTLNRAWVDKRL